ncbi:MAG: polyprenyl synthetase family protein [Planctomycetaceae bacterium]|jgi:geranylgeranyl diphosphate synthase type II|nr:polyprenyl synthetase family protein [Planctomycetaceae bacterium]
MLEFSERFITAANRYIETLRQEVNETLDLVSKFDNGCPPQLGDAVRYSLLAPGKRLRPLFVLLACELCGGQRQLAMPAACAVEMIHCYSLIHDDLPAMDNDDTRRGRPTCHKQFDEATAILAGDALIPAAFEMLAKMEPPELAVRCCRELAVAAGASQLVGGQMDDVLQERTPASPTQDFLERIHLRKTGALIRVSLRLGGLAAEGTEPQLEHLDNFGADFGLAFQITDDLLDVLGDEQDVGKRLHKDSEKGKLSYPAILGVEKSQKEAERLVNKAVDSLTAAGSKDSISFDVLRFMAYRLLNRKC